jgi:hypothetical protein
MAVTQDKPGPYAPASTVLDIVDRYRNRGLVFPVTQEVLVRAGVPESLASRTLQALVALDLFDKTMGNPTETMEGLRLAPEAEFKGRLADWIKAAYADVFKFVDPALDDESRIRDAFRPYEPQGQQGRMVSLFQGLCAAAGLIPEKKKSGAAMSALPVRTRVAQPSRVLTFKKRPPEGSSKNPTGLPAALDGLLKTLPPSDTGWTKAERKKFLDTFAIVLDYSIPIIAEGNAPVAVPDKATNENGGQPMPWVVPPSKN